MKTARIIILFALVILTVLNTLRMTGMTSNEHYDDDKKSDKKTDKDESTPKPPAIVKTGG